MIPIPSLNYTEDSAPGRIAQTKLVMVMRITEDFDFRDFVGVEGDSHGLARGHPRNFRVVLLVLPVECFFRPGRNSLYLTLKGDLYR